MTERDNDDHPFESTDEHELDDREQWLRENVPPHHI
jgi:hypothetical protein